MRPVAGGPTCDAKLPHPHASAVKRAETSAAMEHATVAISAAQLFEDRRGCRGAGEASR